MLYYVADPMCSWCWGFAPVLAELRARNDELPIRYVMGGLAPDSAEPMSPETRSYVRQAWRAVETATGVRFNWDFWERCEPRRSTYPACRAVVAAEHQVPGAGERMFAAVQRAYYQQARNPSDTGTLVALAGEQGLNAARFEEDLDSGLVRDLFAADRDLCQRLGVGGFPTLLWVAREPPALLCRGYATVDEVAGRLEGARAAAPPTRE